MNLKKMILYLGGVYLLAAVLMFISGFVLSIAVSLFV